MKAAALCVAVIVPGASLASPLPAVTGSYVGNYDLGNAFGGHGLWLPGFLGDNTWSVTSGTANYDGMSMVMNGSVENNVGSTTYTLDFDFTVFMTTVEPSSPACGGGACTGATQDMKDNMVYFDMGRNATMGTVTGTGALSGLTMDVVMKPLQFPTPYKPGQLGYGGNWTTLDFGYSNWMDWTVTSNTSGINTGTSNGGDVNFNMLPNGNPGGNNPPPVPLPAGLPLLLAGLGAFAVMRRRAAA